MSIDQRLRLVSLLALVVSLVSGLIGWEHASPMWFLSANYLLSLSLVTTQRDR